MLAFHTDAGRAREAPAALSEGTLPKDVVWVDMLDPDAREVALVEQATGLRVPTRAALSEIESSSRLSSDGGALYLSTPMLVDAAGAAALSKPLGAMRLGADALEVCAQKNPKRGFAAAAPARSNVILPAEPCLAPLGFVLSQDRLLTIRFDPCRAFDAPVPQAGEAPHGRTGSMAIFVALLEELVDLLADSLEQVGTELDALSNRIFGPEITGLAGAKPPRRRDLALRALLRKVGRSGQLLSKIRASLLGIGRIVPYAENKTEHWTGVADAKPRLERLRRDVASLDEFEVHLTDKVQFLLDATLGLISIEQNNTFKVLTIVSVIGIPPTVVASIYGMNFKHMPELDWSWGYGYGLALILLSAVVPAVWFKLRGWF